MGSTFHEEAGVMPGSSIDAAFPPGAGAEPAPSATRPRLLRNPDFLKFWAAHAVSQVGTQVTALALPLLAAVTLGASAFEVGLLAAVGWLPFLLVGLPAGVWADRVRRRPLLIGADIGRGLLLSIVPLAAWQGWLSMPVLYGAALAAGMLTVFFDVAYLSYVPTLVGRDDLVSANGKIESTASAAQIVGPGLGGVLVRVAGGPIAVLLDAVSFLASAALLWRIRSDEPPPAPRHERRPFRAELGEGVATIRVNPVLRGLVLAASTVNLSGYAFLAVYVLYMTRDLGLNAGEIGLVFSTGGVGALIGATLSGPARRWFGIGRSILVGLFLFGFTGLLVPLAVLIPDHALPLVVAAEFLQWLALMIYQVNAVSLRQAIVPDRLAGRVNGAWRFVAGGLRPVGSLLGGALGAAIGLPLTLVVGEVGMLLAFVWLLFSPIVRLRDPEPIEDPR